MSALKPSFSAKFVISFASRELCILSNTSSVADKIDIFGFGIFIRWQKSITFLKMCILVLTFGLTFNAPSVIISGLSSFSNVMCQIWLSLFLPNKPYSRFKTSFIKTSVWICPLTIILILSSEASFAAIFAVLFSTGSSIISYSDISNFISSAVFLISDSLPIKTGTISFSFTASITEIIGSVFPAFAIATLIPFFWWARSNRLFGHTVDLSESI